MPQPARPQALAKTSVTLTPACAEASLPAVPEGASDAGRAPPSPWVLPALGAQASKDLVAPSPSHLQGAELMPCCYQAPGRGKHSLGRGLACIRAGKGKHGAWGPEATGCLREEADGQPGRLPGEAPESPWKPLLVPGSLFTVSSVTGSVLGGILGQTWSI